MLAPRHLTLAATALGSSIAFLDTTVVIVALPSMDTDLGLGLSGQQWVVLGFSLTLAALYLPCGAVGDRFGLRRTFVVGVVLFALASVVCAAAASGGALIAGRAFQGIGAAALTTASLALLRVTWAGREGRAIGLWTSLTSVATVVGPALGGLIVGAASWRWIFAVNVPLSLAVVVLAVAGRVDGEERAGRTTIDVVGAALVAVGLTAVSFALVEGRGHGAGTMLLVGVGVAALAGLVAWTLGAREPLVPPHLLRRPGLGAANVVTFVIYAALSVHLLLLPVYLQFLGLSPLVSGLAFTLPSVGLVLLAPRYGRLADRIGPRRPIAFGAALVALSTVLLGPVVDRGSAWTWATASLIVLAVGLPAVVAPITAAALRPAPEELAGVASGLNQTVARTGGVLAVAGIGSLAGWVFVRAGGVGDAPFDPALEGAARSAAIDAFRAGLVAIGVLAALASALALVLLRDRA